MDGYRTPQETSALRDIAYVVRFGHFPGEEEQAKDGAAARTTLTSYAPSVSEEWHVYVPKKGRDLDETASSGGDVHLYAKENSSSEDANPFSEDANPFTEDANPFSEDTNPFSEDGNPFNEDDKPLYEKASLPDGDPNRDETPSITSDSNLFSEDANLTTEDREATEHAPPTPHPSGTSDLLLQPHASASGQHPTDPFQQMDLLNISRKLVKEAVAQMFNVTQLDLRCLMEEVAKNKENPTVQLQLEELSTEGLGLQPITGSCSPPLVFLRAAVEHSSSFTTFTSTSATRATQDALIMDVKNMYTETLLLQVWSVPVEATVELPAAAPVMDVLTRLIKHAKDRTSPSHPSRVSNEAVTTDNVVQAEATAEVVDRSENTPTTSISMGEKSLGQVEDAASPHDSTKISTSGVEGGIAENEDRAVHQESPTRNETAKDTEAQMPLDNTITISPELEVMASTPRDRSASFQDLDLSPLNSKRNLKPLEKSKSSMGSFKKLSGSSLRASFRSNFRRNKQNGCVMSSEQQGDRPFDTASLVSQNSDGNPVEEVINGSPRGDRSNTLHKEDDNTNSNRLNREKSSSTLSITSFSRLNLSFRLSSKKAKQVFKKIGSKKEEQVSRSETSTPDPSRKFQHPPQYADTSPVTVQKSTDDEIDAAHDPNRIPVPSPTEEESIDFTPYKKKSIRSKFRPRALRNFRSLGDSSTKGPLQVGENESTMDIDFKQVPQNPKEIQAYLSSLGKGHLKAELLAYAKMPLKGMVGKWRKEGWLPMTLVKKESVTSQKKKKGGRSGVEQGSDKVGCRFHLRLTLPSPETELTTTGYDTYYTTLRKLVHAYLRTMHGSLSAYHGEVSPVGDVLLQQLIFFSRVSEPQKNLAKWLILTEVKPGDPGTLLPLLRAIKTHMEAGIYLTAQKRQLGIALVTWVRKVLSDEFEMLHSSFPRREGLLELARLENFLRCFNTVENCYELRVLFEREAAPLGHSAITDLLQDVLVKHADQWVEALSKEKLEHDGGDTTSTAATTSEERAWLLWQESLRRASLLTKPILDFLTISFHTYQPIFMLELSVDYMYLVMPKMLKAAAHLLNPLLKFDVDGASHNVTAKHLAAAAQGIWVLITNLSNINKVGISSHLPQHLILQAYHDAFSEMMHHWLVLSKHLALQEFHKDIQEDQFVAIDSVQGFSHSAVGVADLMKAVMKRMCSVQWPGGVGPGVTTLQMMGQQMMELAALYAEKVTHAYISTAAQANNIPSEVCVVVRNVEHVCHEVRKHLLHLAEMAGEAREVVQKLHDRTTHLQEHIDDSAEALLRQCLPDLEKMVTKAVRQKSSQQVVKILEEAINPVHDRLYFAEPLLHQLWYRLVDHAEQLKAFFVQGEYRDDLRQLRVVLESSHDFLTDPDGISLTLLEEVSKKYESVQAELKLLGATSAELVSQFYQIRHQDQQREDSSSGQVLVFSAMFMKGGLRIHVVQAPGMPSVASLVKVRLEPFQWFPAVEPLKTHPTKGDPAVFDEILEFPGVLGDCKEGGGVLTLQVRSPRLLSSSIVHGEVILPLAEVPSVPESEVFSGAHLRLPLTRPWDFRSYKPLEALMTRTQDKPAMEFLKTLNERWKPGDSSELTPDSSKLLANFARTGSVRNIKASGKKHPRRGTLVK